MRGSKLVEDAAGRVLRTVVDGDDLQIRIIDFHQRVECGGEFFFFVTRREENRNARTTAVGCRCEILDPGKTNGAIGNVNAVSKQEERNETKENQYENMHGNRCQRCARVIITCDDE